MNNNLTELIFVLDRSGSMEHLSQETIGGFNSLIQKQKKENRGEVLVTTVLFDDNYEVLHDHLPIRKVPRLTEKEYYARGCTALLDAVGRTIDNVGLRLSKTPEHKRPGKILFVITTDGYENASQDYTKQRVKEMISLQQDTYKWKFLFLGANIDAVGEADSLGIRRSAACAPSASPLGIKTSFSAINRLTGFLRKRYDISSDEFDEDYNDECEDCLSSIK